MKNLISIDNLVSFLKENENWLMNKILFYAKKYDYTKYTSTLLEPWRLSIAGLTGSIELLLEKNKEIPQMGPDDKYVDDPASIFGVKEAKLHRSRGVNLSMFFSLLKYYRQSYIDLLDENIEKIVTYEYLNSYINRFFDRIETAFVTEWSGSGAEEQIHELSKKNRNLANEKNRYLTIFDSIDSPAIVTNNDFIIKNVNASSLFFNINNAGSYYYTEQKKRNINTLIDIELIKSEEYFEWSYKERSFLVFSKPLHDISSKNEGYIIIFNDITKLKQSEDMMISQSKYAAMGEMLNLISHQWRQPLTSIAMDINNILLDISLESLDHNILEDNCKDMLNQLNYLSNTVDDFRDFFKPKDKKSSIKISKVIEDLNLLVGKSLQYNDITVKTLIEDDIEINIYKGKLVQVLLSIINNAKDIFKDSNIKNKKIDVLVNKDKENLIIKIVDNAGGIKKENINKIFEPYFSTKIEKNGTGLGLYISMTIVVKHLKGELLVNNVSDGACFTIKLPIEEECK